MNDFYSIKKESKRNSRKIRGASARVLVETRRSKIDDIKVVLKKVFYLMAGVGILYLTTHYFTDFYERVSTQKIETVKIEGSLNYVTEDEVSRIVSRFTDQSLVTINLDLVKQGLEVNPWIKTVNIRREWPGTIIINVVEEIAIARWRESQLLNQEGRVFSPDSVLEQAYLPYLTGPEGQEQQVMEQFRKFNQLLYPLGLRVATLGVNSRGAWDMQLENGITIKAGKTKVMEKMRRLVSFMGSNFIEQMINIESIDLRYSNGISVKKRELAVEEMVSL